MEDTMVCNLPLGGPVCECEAADPWARPFPDEVECPPRGMRSPDGRCTGGRLRYECPMVVRRARRQAARFLGLCDPDCPDCLARLKAS